MIRRLLPVFIMILAATSASGARAEPKVVVSIKPVHSLVAGVMQGVGTPSLLLEGAASPHSSSLRPSQARSIESAQIIFWIGEDLELFLARALKTLGRDSAAVALMNAPGVSRLANRRAGALDERHDEVPDGQGHGSGDDPHIWLDPDNAIAMTLAIRDVLSEADPENARRYSENAETLSRRLKELTAALENRLAPIANRRFVVFHDAFQYFERRFGLTSAGILTLNPELSPGARRLGEVRDKISRSRAVCIFAEPQFEPKIVSMIAAETNIRWSELDPLGSNIAPGPELYFGLLADLAASFRRCLGEDS
jgi:zinc transport system substrate-binding protein